MNNKKAQTTNITFGFALITVFIFLLLVNFATIDVFKESLDEIRGTSSLNCPGTPDFNRTAFVEDETSDLNKLTRRPTCFVTGLTMVWFIGAFTIASSVWVIVQWRKIAK